jgi:3-phenylpropionate/cinnamic acid dioxygenase small subunit
MPEPVSAALAAAIHALNARYAQAIDDDELEAWPAFFTENGRYVVTTAENYARCLPIGLIYATSQAMIRDRVKSLREANIYEAQRYRHIVGLPLLEAAADGSVTARTSFIVVRIMHTGEMAVFATGSYRDRFVTEPGGAVRLAERVAVLDSRQIDTLLALPI